MGEPLILCAGVAFAALVVGLALGFSLAERRRLRWQRQRDLAAADFQRRLRAFQDLHQQIVPGRFGGLLADIPLDLPDHAADLAASSPGDTLPWPVPGVSRNRPWRIGAGETR